MEKLLVVVDMQNDFIDGALGSEEAKRIVPAVVDKIKKHEGEIVFTLDTHKEDYLDTQEGRNLPVVHCKEGTHGHKVHKDLLDAAKDKKYTEIVKYTFGSTALGEKVARMFEEGLREVEIVGLVTDICVLSNTLLIKAFCPEMLVTVDASCCAGSNREVHENALKAMKQCQINVINE